VADATFLDQSALVASGILERLERRRKAKKHRLYKATVAVFVILIHVLVVLLLIRTTLIVVKMEKPPQESRLLWLLLPRANQISGNRNEKKADEMIRQAYKAVQLLPRVVENADRPNAITVDSGLALGQALACGAGKFEYLTVEGRARCVSKPWNFTYDRYGYIVMDMRDPQQKKRDEQKVRNSDVMARQRNTQPVCPTYVDPNAPCFARALRGDALP
jgi:hypothetical protein